MLKNKLSMAVHELVHLKCCQLKYLTDNQNFSILP